MKGKLATPLLQDSGVTQATLKFGDQGVITGAPPKGNERKLLMQRIVRSADKWTWQGQVGRRALDEK